MPKLLLTPDLTLYSALRRLIAANRRKAAVTFEGQTITYQELGERVDALAHGLRALGVGPGDRIAVILPNCLEFVYAFFAPGALGAVMILMNPVSTQREMQHILTDCEASVIITETRPMGNNLQAILQAIRPSLPKLQHVVMRGEAAPGAIGFAELMRDAASFQPAQVSPEDLCALIYTSGTTGTPKAVMQSHRSIIAAVRYGESSLKEMTSARFLFGLIRKYDLRFLKWGPRQHAALSPAAMHALLGYGALVYGLLYGGRVVIADRFNPAKVLALIEQEHVNMLMATPTMVSALLSSREFSPRKVSSLLYIAMGAAPCPPELVRRAREMFGCPVLIAFGATEIGVTLTTSPVDSDAMQLETVGRLIPGIEAKVVDEQHQELSRGQTGELAMRLPSVMLGYHNAPDINATVFDQEGWYFTGDLATMDEEGYIRIVGRKKDMIIRGGQNVYPAEIEKHLSGKPGIANVAVVGVPDSVVGERIWAFVLPTDGTQLTPGDVLGYCRGELAPYKVPEQVRVVADLPMTSTGKVQKFVLRARALKELEQAEPGAAPGPGQAASS
jgi:fatty-acyl-CoA synthase